MLTLTIHFKVRERKLFASKEPERLKNGLFCYCCVFVWGSAGRSGGHIIRVYLGGAKPERAAKGQIESDELLLLRQKSGRREAYIFLLNGRHIGTPNRSPSTSRVN